MRFIITMIVTAAAAVMAVSQHIVRDSVMPYPLSVPSLDVPDCSTGQVGKVNANNTVPSNDTSPFPATDVSLCYDDNFIRIVFEAFEEKSFYCKFSLSDTFHYQL